MRLTLRQVEPHEPLVGSEYVVGARLLGGWGAIPVSHASYLHLKWSSDLVQVLLLTLIGCSMSAFMCQHVQRVAAYIHTCLRASSR